MKTQKPKKNDNFFAYLIGLFFIGSSALFGAFVMSEDHLHIGPAQGQSEFSSIKKETDLDKINDHMKSVSDKMEYERLKAMVDNMKAGHEASLPSQPIVQNNGEPIVELENDMRERDFAQQIGRTSEIKKQPSDPRTLVYNSVIQDRATAKAKEDERRRLAKEFVAKARKDGWIVNLDADFKIKSYRHVEDIPEQDRETDYRGYSVIPK